MSAKRSIVDRRDSDQDEDTPFRGKRTRGRNDAASPPQRELSLSFGDVDTAAGLSGQAEPSRSQIIDNISQRTWIALEMDVSRDAMKCLEALPETVHEEADEIASAQQVALYKVLIRQSNLYGFVSPSAFGEAQRSKRSMTALIDSVLLRMKGMI